MVAKTGPAKKTQPKKETLTTTTQPAKKKKPPKKAPVTTTQPAKKKIPPKKAPVKTTKPVKKMKVTKKTPVKTTQPAKKIKAAKKAPVKKKQPAKKIKAAKKAPVKKKQPAKKIKAAKKAPVKTKQPAKKKTQKKAPVTTTPPIQKLVDVTEKEKKKKITKTIPKKPQTPKKVQKVKEQSISKVKHNLDKTFFCVLRDYGSYVNKKAKLKKQYPWIARVVHSRTQDFPHKCTAACIGPRLFVTAARCITVLVVEYTHVMYDGVRMPVLAFVVPSRPTKQMFDDIGIVVVEATSYRGPWPSIGLTTMTRTDDDYQWLDKLQLEQVKFGTHVVVGYAKEKLNSQDTVYTEFKLSSLNVVVGMSLCYKILQEKKPESPDYWVPCYHSCSVKLHRERNPTCFKYLGALGAAVIDSRSNTLIGVATWGTRLTLANPPVGFAIPNSKNFFEDLACAKKVLKDNGATADMQRLCPLPK